MRVNKKFFLPPSISLAAFSLPCQDSANLGECVSGIYSWSLAVVGIVAFVQIIYAGWLYLTAAGNIAKAGDAMSKISNAVLGIVLLFSSYLILNTINPDLVGGSFGLPDLTGTKIEKVYYGNGTTTTLPDGVTSTTLGDGSTTTTFVNVPLEFSDIAPTVLYSGGHDQTYLINGTGFQPSMEIYIYNSSIFDSNNNSVSIYADLQVVNSTTAYAVIKALDTLTVKEGDAKVTFYLSYTNGFGSTDFGYLDVVSAENQPEFVPPPAK